MLASRILLPDRIPVMTAEDAQLLRERVVAANEVLREEAAKLADHTVEAEWRLSPVTPPPRAELVLSLGQARLTHQFFLGELADPANVRKRLRNELWYLVATYSANNQKEITRLLSELRQDHALAGK
ncbi:MAG TPA: hypothetical protein VFG68_03685 [Fimbriiglobus sp.]|nr:hypothetical protein [Fimbriiglobus sp.]